MQINSYSSVEATKNKVWLSVKDKPNRFQAVVLLYSKANDYSNAILEWNSVYGSDDTTETCICSQEISDLYYIKNRITGATLIVGCDCIEKLGSKELQYDVRLRSKLRKKLKNYDGDKPPCLHCGTRKKNEDLWYCTKCLSNHNNIPSRVVIESLGVMECFGCCGAFIPRLSHTLQCDKCEAPSHNSCRSCGDPLADKPRCLTCYRNKMPIKCKTTCCLNMIPYTDRTAWEVLCDGCKSKQSRVCRRDGCGNILPSTTPIHYTYCSWSCRQS